MGSSKIASLLKSKAGASMMFFLAVMFLLMIISGSVLVVAGNARSTGLERQKTKQIEVLAQSVTKSLQEAILKDGGFNKDIVLEIYKNKKNSPLLDYSGFKIEPKFGTDIAIPGNMIFENIDITFDNQNVEIVPEVPAITDESGTEILPRIPEKAYIDFQMTATVICKDTTGQILKSSLTYNYLDGYLEDGAFVPQTSGGAIYFGDWEVKAYAQKNK